MAGRPPRLNWTKSLGQYTTTINKKLHRLGADKTAAEQQFRFLLSKHDFQEPIATVNPTFAEIADRWLSHVEENCDPERYRLCKARLEEFVQLNGLGLRVRDLRPSHVESWLDSKNELKAGTRRLYSAMILAALNWAASRKVRLISSNPLRGLLDLPEGGSRGGDIVWSQAVFKLVLRTVNQRFADYLRAVAWTGARPGTVRKVEARHYNASLKLWEVDELGRGKKKARRIWLSPEVVELTERLNSEFPEGPIFRNTRNAPYTGDVVTMMMYKTRLRLAKQGHSVPSNLCVYGLRHTFATNFIKQHPDKLEYLRELMGHKDMQMIRKHYGHLFDEHNALHKVLDKLKPL